MHNAIHTGKGTDFQQATDFQQNVGWPHCCLAALHAKARWHHTWSQRLLAPQQASLAVLVALEVASVYPLATSAAQQASVRLGPSKPRVGPIAPHACGGLG